MFQYWLIKKFWIVPQDETSNKRARMDDGQAVETMLGLGSRFLLCNPTEIETPWFLVGARPHFNRKNYHLLNIFIGWWRQLRFTTTNLPRNHARQLQFLVLKLKPKFLPNPHQHQGFWMAHRAHCRFQKVGLDGSKDVACLHACIDRNSIMRMNFSILKPQKMGLILKFSGSPICSLFCLYLGGVHILT